MAWAAAAALAEGPEQERLAIVASTYKRVDDPALRARAALANRGERRELPGTVGGWLEREERAAQAARKRGDERGFRYHSIRMSVLREMHQAKAKMPVRRLDRVERKLDEILEMLRRRDQ